MAADRPAPAEQPAPSSHPRSAPTLPVALPDPADLVAPGAPADRDATEVVAVPPDARPTRKHTSGADGARAATTPPSSS